MESRTVPHLYKLLQWPTFFLGAMCLGLVGYAFLGYEDPTHLQGRPNSRQLQGQQQILDLQGRLLPIELQGRIMWKTLTPEDIEKGVTLPAHTNVIMHLPEGMQRISRKTLFGRRGNRVRYWGYCFPEDFDRAQALRRRGFPGTVFLSEAERDSRRAKLQFEKRRTFSVFKHLTEKDLNETEVLRGRVRHQQEIFKAGMSCYVMTSEGLPVGIDSDQDGANSKVEDIWRSDPNNPDTDGDGISDGLEIFSLGTFPNKRDSDGDGLIDGLEDKNQNGVWDIGETNPMDIDTDRDGLCDGICKVDRGTQIRGEDKNLNGVVDPGEYDPLKVDTDGDGVLDEQEYFNCLLAGGADC